MTVSSAQPQRWSGVDIDTDAIAANVRSLVDLCSPSAVWAVVKANGYGHGAVWASRAALAGGAAGVAVALTQEAVELRAAGIDSRVLILSDQPHEQYDELLAADAEVMVYRLESVDALAAAAARLGTTARVHLKIDTGMRRVGAEPSEAADIVTRIAEASGVELVGVATHLATADTPGHPAIEEQMERFVSAVSGLDLEVELHIANSAAAITLPESRQTFVRTGIAMYGIDPSAEVPLNRASFTAALRWWARVSMVKEVDEGVHVSYGWRYRTSSPTR
ncbi:MAG: alanine racemase, partial [Ilumatobacteraceae bacterium]